jgi:hypothetical protein
MRMFGLWYTSTYLNARYGLYYPIRTASGTKTQPPTALLLLNRFLYHEVQEF